MLHWMPYCLLLKNGYCIGDVFFSISELSPDLRADFFDLHPREIIASKILFAKNGGSLLRFVRFEDWKGREEPFL